MCVYIYIYIYISQLTSPTHFDLTYTTASYTYPCQLSPQSNTSCDHRETTIVHGFSNVLK